MLVLVGSQLLQSALVVISILCSLCRWIFKASRRVELCAIPKILGFQPEISILGAEVYNGATEHVLRTRGFIVLSVSPIGGYANHVFSIALAPTLVTKLAVTLGLPLKKYQQYDPMERNLITMKALDILSRMKMSGLLQFDSAMLIHDYSNLNALAEEHNIKTTGISERIAKYFGCRVGLFFEWHLLRTNLLAIAHVTFGLLIWILGTPPSMEHKPYISSVSFVELKQMLTPGRIGLVLLFPLTALAFSEFWNSRQTALHVLWKTGDDEDTSCLLTLYSYNNGHDGGSKRKKMGNGSRRSQKEHETGTEAENSERANNNNANVRTNQDRVINRMKGLTRNAATGILGACMFFLAFKVVQLQEMITLKSKAPSAPDVFVFRYWIVALYCLLVPTMMSQAIRCFVNTILFPQNCSYWHDSVTYARSQLHRRRRDIVLLLLEGSNKFAVPIILVARQLLLLSVVQQQQQQQQRHQYQQLHLQQQRKGALHSGQGASVCTGTTSTLPNCPDDWHQMTHGQQPFTGFLSLAGVAIMSLATADLLGTMVNILVSARSKKDDGAADSKSTLMTAAGDRSNRRPNKGEESRVNSKISTATGGLDIATPIATAVPPVVADSQTLDNKTTRSAATTGTAAAGGGGVGVGMEDRDGRANTNPPSKSRTRTWEQRRSSSSNNPTTRSEVILSAVTVATTPDTSLTSPPPIEKKKVIGIFNSPTTPPSAVSTMVPAGGAGANTSGTKSSSLFAAFPTTLRSPQTSAAATHPPTYLPATVDTSSTRTRAKNGLTSHAAASKGVLSVSTIAKEEKLSEIDEGDDHESSVDDSDTSYNDGDDGQDDDDVVEALKVNEKEIADAVTREIKLQIFDESEDYLKMLTQYGYTALAAPLMCPLLPLFYAIANIGYIGDIRRKLYGSRRPMRCDAGQPKHWVVAFEVLTLLSTLFNISIILIYLHMNILMTSADMDELPVDKKFKHGNNNLNTSHTSTAAPPLYDHHKQSTADSPDLICGKYVSSPWCALVASLEGKVLIICSAALLHLTVRTVIGWLGSQFAGEAVRVEMARQRREKQEKEAANRLRLYGMKALLAVSETKGKEKALQDLTRDRLSHLYNKTGWAMAPGYFVALALTPYAAGHLGLPFYFTMPACLLLCSYLHTKHTRQIRASAVEVASDSDLFKAFMEELPQFVLDPDMQRCEWINSILEQVWDELTQYACDAIRTAVEPMLAKAKPSFINDLGFKKLSLGTVPPKILGIRVLQGKLHSEKVELEVDFKWASNIQVAVLADVGHIGELIGQITEFHFSGSIRVELLPKMPCIPPFGYLRVTFMKKPYVDFSILFGDLDVDIMNVGAAGGYGISGAIQKTIKSVLQSIVLYPQWLQIPLQSDVNVDTFRTDHPNGVLSLSILSCSNLKVADITTSDPFVEIKFGDETYRTDIVYRNLNPVWKNANFNLLVHDLKSQVLTLHVWDSDLGSYKIDPLGMCEVYLDTLIPDEPQEREITLTETSSGSIRIRMVYVALSSGNGNTQEDDDDEDVLFNIPESGLTNDILFQEVDDLSMLLSNSPSKSLMAAGGGGGGGTTTANSTPSHMRDATIGVHPGHLGHLDPPNGASSHQSHRKSFARRALNLFTGHHDDSSDEDDEQHRRGSLASDSNTGTGTVKHLHALRGSDLLRSHGLLRHSSAAHLGTHGQMAAAGARRLKSSDVAGILTVYDINCQHLMMKGGIVTPKKPITTSFLNLDVGHQHKRTQVKTKTASPSFPETFHFVITDPHQQTLAIKLKSPGIIKTRKTLATTKVKVLTVVLATSGGPITVGSGSAAASVGDGDSNGPHEYVFDERIDNEIVEGVFRIKMRYLPSTYKIDH